MRDERATAPHRAQIAASTMAQLGQAAGAVVGHGVMLQIIPDVFDRIQLQAIRGRSLDQPRQLRVHAIPDNQQSRACASQQFEKLNDLRTLDRTGEEAKVEAPIVHLSDDRQFILEKGVLQSLRSALLSPECCATGSFGQTRLVDEDEHSELPRSDFYG